MAFFVTDELGAQWSAVQAHNLLCLQSCALFIGTSQKYGEVEEKKSKGYSIVLCLSIKREKAWSKKGATRVAVVGMGKGMTRPYFQHSHSCYASSFGHVQEFNISAELFRAHRLRQNVGQLCLR